MRTVLKVLLVLGFVCVLAGCATTKPPKGDEDPDPGKPTLAEAMLAAVNEVRTAGTTCGGVAAPPVDPLTLNDLLAQAAQGHSDDMFAHGSMSHAGSDGSTPDTRIAATGYRASWWGENVAAGFETVDEVMDAWLKSSGHCSNIMNSHFTELGVGEAGHYWTQVFGRPF
ncbi:MAG: CAP domain-containing protein [Trueperaceae bacterium]|nr:CAP domain-containing protein [Trueperaceae bacterium]MCO5173553.1 CAP domain-containing protein [Trueperaceae bacterium]MCW5818541.1 CAP domain-containing protein [Trueperaceae bacterium]